MFRKLVDLLFKEEEYVEEDIVEVEPVRIKQTPVNRRQNKAAGEKSSDSSNHRTTVLSTSETVIESPLKTPVTETAEGGKDKPSIRLIDVDEEDVEVPTKVRLMSEPEDEYVFTPVISPIYGVKSPDDAYIPPKKPVKSSQTPKEHATLNTIISPFYGKIGNQTAGELHRADHGTIQDPSLSLEDMLDESSDDNELVQVSLFDEQSED